MRKAQKLEEAYLTWLNMHRGVLERLRALSHKSERDSHSTVSLREMLHLYDEVQADLLKLEEAVNAAFLFETKGSKKLLLQSHSEILALLATDLGEILGHHRLHLKFLTTMEKAQEQVEKYNKLLSDSGPGKSAEEHREGFVESLEEAVRLRDAAMEHLATCTRRLHSDAKKLTEELEKVIYNAKVVREAIAG